MLVIALNKTCEDHLQSVMKEMEEQGAPVIRVYDDGDAVYALEGSHRLEAARRLGINPIFIFMEEDDEFSDCDWDVCWESFPPTVGEMMYERKSYPDFNPPIFHYGEEE